MFIEKSFEQWKNEVNVWCEHLTGLSADDIDDWCYADDYNEGLAPKTSARRAIKNSMECCGL